MRIRLRRYQFAVFSAFLFVTGLVLPDTESWAQSQSRSRLGSVVNCQVLQNRLTQQRTPLSACLSASRDATIGGQESCQQVYVDQSYTGANALGTITILPGGELTVLDTTLAIETAAIIVQGELDVGTATCLIGTLNPDNQVTITFTGTRPAITPSVGHAHTDDCDPFAKGIQVRSGGKLNLYGAKGVPPSGVSWTHLSEPAGPAKYGPASGAGSPVMTDDRTLQLNKDVTRGPNPWKPGDWITVATTSFSPFETEFMQIKDVQRNGSGSTVTLEQSVRHYHFGGPDPGPPSSKNYNAGPELNYGVDERAEVGLISRNIKLTAQVPDPQTSPGDPSLHWGGEIKICNGFADANIAGVEIEKFGKDQLGSYPIHFHLTGDVAGKPRVNANSIHHSYNKCVTIHSTSNMTVQNTVCARIVGHIFYQEIGNEENIRYRNNLGLGAMSHYFNITPPKNIEKYWWVGDNLAKINGYDGFNIPNIDSQTNPTHGGCFVPRGDGGIVLQGPPPCAQNQLYVEPASGFWIINPGTALVGNSIGGCQGIGVGYWYVPPADGSRNAKKFLPVGTFKNNRVHGCYDGIFAETQFGVQSEQLFPRVGGVLEGKSLIARFDGFTATRNRDRGIWMRPTWFVFDDTRLATNRDSVSLVSSGGNDGNAPGVWALLKDSVIVGFSKNNVDRFGPCANPTSGINLGCIDQNPSANDELERGYPIPRWNFAGYMIYDGPVRIEHNRFVNFNVDIRPHLTNEDRQFLSQFVAYPNTSGVYEGDAALGWFQSNQSAYPTATIAKDLSFDNVDLRHQIYTEKVNLVKFNDSDLQLQRWDYEQEPPANQNKLAYVVPRGVNPANGIIDGELVTPVPKEEKPGFPHSEAMLEPWCPITTGFIGRRLR